MCHIFQTQQSCLLYIITPAAHARWVIIIMCWCGEKPPPPGNTECFPNHKLPPTSEMHIRVFVKHMPCSCAWCKACASCWCAKYVSFGGCMGRGGQVVQVSICRGSYAWLVDYQGCFRGELETTYRGMWPRVNLNSTHLFINL